MRQIVASPQERNSLLTEIIASVYSPLLGLAVRIVKDRDTAEDIVNDSLCELLVVIGTDKAPDQVFAWMSEVVRNKSLNYLNQQQTRRRILTDRVLEIAQGEVAEVPTPVNEPKLAQIKKALTRLPARTQELLLMRYRDELAPEQIAPLLAISPNAASARLMRAHQHLELELALDELSPDLRTAYKNRNAPNRLARELGISIEGAIVRIEIAKKAVISTRADFARARIETQGSQRRPYKMKKTEH